jgi:hypothetical protein
MLIGEKKSEKRGGVAKKEGGMARKWKTKAKK